jgi:lipoprotein-anchoring transpeptidase ErfK/SrfK
MSFRSVLPVLVLAALAGVFVMSYSALSAASVGDREPEPEPAALPLPAPPPPAPAAESTAPQAQEPKQGPRWRSLASLSRRGHAVAIVRRSVPLRTRPNGRRSARARRWTEFGDQRVMSIAQQRGPWLGVVATERPNGKLAWIHMKHRGLAFRRRPYSLHADLSGRWVELRKRGRRTRRFSVAIGRPGSPTPTGRFAVTDKLHGPTYGSYYGCCILALNGHQTNLPPGWTGGNRLAIHGTNAPGTIGAAASAGCLRAADADLRVLVRRVPLGTPVFIRR